MHMHNSSSLLPQLEIMIQHIEGISLLCCLLILGVGRVGHERVYRMDRRYRLYLLLGCGIGHRGCWGMRIDPGDGLDLVVSASTADFTGLVYRL